MKTTLPLLLAACVLCACHHRNRDPEIRRYAPNTDYRRTHNAERNHRTYRSSSPKRARSTETDNMNRLPYLPPFVMRWDCPPEPQMLGYAMR